MEFVEFTTINKEVVLVKLENITLAKKNKREYPDWVDSYSVIVNGWNFKLDKESGEAVYAQYNKWLLSRAK